MHDEPIDTTSVELPEQLEALTERLAAHIHAVWARGREEEGWVYGPHRDDTTRTHPGLVPYDDLSESEKDYDRRTALEAIRAILALGYRIRPPSGEDSDRR